MKNLGLRILKVLITFLVIVNMNNSFGQDFHLSQYDASPIILNPSLTGMYGVEEMRMTSQYRSQWGALTSSLTSSAMSFDMRLKDRWGIGAYIMDNNGAKVFNTFNLILSGAYEVTINGGSMWAKDYRLFVGLQAGMIYKGTNDDRLVFDEQYYAGNFDSDLPSGEVFDKNGLVMPDLNYGISYMNVNREQRVNPYLGFSLFHITSPKESFFNEKESRLPRRFLVHGGTKININESVFVDPKFLCMWQKNASEYVFGIKGYYNLNNSDIWISGGSLIRLKDAVIIMLGVDYNNVIFQISYDINTSGLKAYSKGRGGLEFAVIYNTGRKKEGEPLRY